MGGPATGRHLVQIVSLTCFWNLFCITITANQLNIFVIEGNILPLITISCLIMHHRHTLLEIWTCLHEIVFLRKCHDQVSVAYHYLRHFSATKICQSYLKLSQTTSTCSYMILNLKLNDIWQHKLNQIDTQLLFIWQFKDMLAPNWMAIVFFPKDTGLFELLFDIKYLVQHAKFRFYLIYSTCTISKHPVHD